MAIINSWIIFRCKFPDSEINSQRAFRLKLVEEMVQPLLSLYSLPTCPAHLHGKGRPTVADDNRLIGKHFSYTHPEGLRQRCSVCSKQVSPVIGKRKDTKTKNYCLTCNKFLCKGSCFEVYHTHTEF